MNRTKSLIAILVCVNTMSCTPSDPTVFNKIQEGITLSLELDGATVTIQPGVLPVGVEVGISTHAADPSPTLVFLHMISPHEPFVFDEDGRDVSPHDLPYMLNRIYDDPELPNEPGGVGPEYARRYRAQASYLAERVTSAARDILRRSPEPPIILVLGDHGPFGFSPNVRQPRFAILNALFLPDWGDDLLYPTISPVNSIRVVLNHYFGTSMPLLPDKRFRSTYRRLHLYEEID